MTSQNIYEYQKINKIDRKQMVQDALNSGDYDKFIHRKIMSKIDEVVLGYNKLAKDFELYKKAFKQHVIDYRNHSHKDHHFPADVEPILCDANDPTLNIKTWDFK